MQIYSHSLQGKRESNEDQHISVLNLDNKIKGLSSINFIGVYDGHGGKLVSKYIKENLPPYFLSKSRKKYFTKNSNDAKKFFYGIFSQIQNKLQLDHPIAAKRCGTTALNGIIYKNRETNSKYLWLLNVGDSRAVLLNHKNSTIQLTEDHKPNKKSEKTRIEKLGGKIYYDGYDWRIENLSLSRAFGDLDTSPYVTHKPDVYKYKLCKNDKFIIFACDGLWDVVSNQDATNFVSSLVKKKFNGNYAKSLTQYAYKKGSTDNITVSILFLGSK